MIPPEDQPPLRLAPQESPEDLERRLRREQTLRDRRREEDLEEALPPGRVGSVPYLNSVPLTRGLEDQVVFATPARLAAMLAAGELDAALVSITEVLFDDRYDILDGIAVASLGEVKSVFLAHRRPLAEVREVYCDAASKTSVNLLRVLLAERGLQPEFRELGRYEDAHDRDFVLLIGNPALEFRFSHPVHELWDLGQAWYELTNLPFVYAVWALRRGLVGETTRRLLREARDFGLDTLDYLIESRPEFDRDFRRDYLGWHIHFHLGMDEKRGIDRFVELLRRHQDRPVHDPQYVQ